MSFNPVAVVTTPPLAAGNYIVVATATAFPDTSKGDLIGCVITATSFNSSLNFVFVGSPSTTTTYPSSYVPISVTDTAAVPAGSTISLKCKSTSGDSNSQIINAQISAIQLNAVGT
jgi:hypothetical protein